MKLIRFGPVGQERPGCVAADGSFRDLSDVLPDFSGEYLDPDSLATLKHIPLLELPKVDASTRLGPPVCRVGKIVGIGLNYADHAAEAGMDSPNEPAFFLKAASAIVGPFDDVLIPKDAQEADWEVELAVIIGRRAARVSAENALEFVAGYSIMNDISERHFQLKLGSQWSKGKSLDTFAPLGPWLVTPDEVGDPHRLAMTLEVDDTCYQSSSTANMIFKVPEVVSYVSRFMTLAPGDVITTGTPAGVGMGQRPPVYLKDGNIMTLSIENLGTQRQAVRTLAI